MTITPAVADLFTHARIAPATDELITELRRVAWAWDTAPVKPDTEQWLAHCLARVLARLDAAESGFAYLATTTRGMPLGLYTSRAAAHAHAEDFARARFGDLPMSWRLSDPEDGRPNTDTPRPDDGQTLYLSTDDGEGNVSDSYTEYRIAAMPLETQYDDTRDS